MPIILYFYQVLFFSKEFSMTDESKALKATAQQRDSKGRFLKGNKGSPGRAPIATERKYLASMTSVVSVDDWIEITEQAVEDAKGGNWRARDWLSKYLVGPPAYAIQMQMEEIEEDSGRKIKKMTALMRNLVGVLEGGDEDEDDCEIEGDYDEV
ncbi:MAG: hypothetical protein GF347_00565 [Candidatus Moranbacteria bacterium]|nr:hypothetical protein [Candidatus Moranbacteria bacterium]